MRSSVVILINVTVLCGFFGFGESLSLREGKVGLENKAVDNKALQQVFDAHLKQLTDADVHKVPNANGVIMEVNGKPYPQKYFDCQMVRNTLANAKGVTFLFGDSQIRQLWGYLNLAREGDHCMCERKADYLVDTKQCELSDKKQPGNIGYSKLSETHLEVPKPLYAAADLPHMNQTVLTAMKHVQGGVSTVVWGQMVHYLHHGKDHPAPSVKKDYLKDRQQIVRDMESVYQQAVGVGASLVVFRTGNPYCDLDKHGRISFTDPGEEKDFLAWCNEQGFPEDNCRDLHNHDHGQRILADLMKTKASALQEAFNGQGPLVLFQDNLQLYSGHCPSDGSRHLSHWPELLSAEADALMHAMIIARTANQ